MWVEFILLFIPVLCWDKEGHEAVGGTAMSMLDSKASSKLKSLLGGDDASDVAGWAHRIEGQVGWTSSLHFMQQEADWACKISDSGTPSVCDDGRCLEVSIRHFFRQLMNGEKVAGKNVMKDESHFTDSDALRFLINLIGDLTQALHVGFKSNNFGKSYFVKLPSGLAVGSNEVVSLYDLWDSKLTELIINNPQNPNFWWSGWTHVRNLHPSIIEREKEKWDRLGIEAVQEWLNESAEFACSHIYTNPITRERLSFSSDPTSPTSISIDVIKVWEQSLKEKILIAGLRLGNVLNAVLTSAAAQSVGKLRRGSVLSDGGDSDKAVENVFDDVQRGDRSYPKTTGYNAGLVNLGIMAFAVIVVIIIVKFFGSVDPVSLKAAKSQVVELVGTKSDRFANSHKD